MKGILSLCLCQTLLLLVLQNIRICHADDPSEPYDLEKSYYEEHRRNNRAWQTQANAQANSQFQTLAYNQARSQAEAGPQAQLRNFKNGDFNHGQTYAIREANAQSSTSKSKSTFSGFNRDAYSKNKRANGEPDNVGRSESLRKPLMEYASAARGYDGTRNSDNSENVEIATNGSSLIDGDTSKINILPDCSKCFAAKYNNSLLGDSNNNLFKSSIATATATSGAASCACDGGFGTSDEVSFLCFSSKDGGKSFSMKYKGITNFNLEDIVKAYKFYYNNMQVNDVNFENNFNNENNFKHEFDGDKFNVGLNKFKFNTFKEGLLFFNTEDQFDLNEIKKSNKKFEVNNFDLNMNTHNDDSNKFNFDVIKNDAQNIDINTHLNDNNKFNAQFEKQFNSNFNFDTNSNLKALKKINSLIESQKNNKFNLNNDLNVNHYSFDSDMHADMQAEIEAQAQAKALAQAKAIAKAQAIFQAQAQAQAEANAQAVIQTQMNAQAQAEAQAEVMAQAHAQANSQFEVQNQVQTQANIQAHAQAHAQSHVQAQAHAQAQVHAQAQAQNQFFNGQAQPFGLSTINKNVGPNNVGAGGDKAIFANGGFSMGFNGAFGVGGSFGMQKMNRRDDGLATNTAVGDYRIGNELNYPDSLQYEDIPIDNFRDYSAGFIQE